MLTRRFFLAATAATMVPGGVRAADPAIVATTGMIADAARALSGLPVTALIGPGMDPPWPRRFRPTCC